MPDWEALARYQEAIERLGETLKRHEAEIEEQERRDLARQHQKYEQQCQRNERIVVLLILVQVALIVVGAILTYLSIGGSV